MELPEPSDEQSVIINSLKDYNVIVDCASGVGKTTTTLHIAREYDNSSILLLTYNSKLKLETRKKIVDYSIENMEVHSFHSFCVKYFDNKCFTDSGIISLLKRSSTIEQEFYYNLIIIDEAQDLNNIYYQLFCLIYKFNKADCKICILGDKNQSIYDFNGADKRYIIYADKIFDFNEHPWEKCRLSLSFRLTDPMVNFINNCVLNYDRLRSNKRSRFKPRYLICNTFNKKNLSTFDEVKYYLNLGYKPDDIFILAPSVRNKKSPVRVLENRIKTSMSRVPIFVPTSDDETLDNDVIKGKLVFSTFHQVKGQERKVVIVFNFDNTYFKFFKRNSITHICPNEFYVALTRASERLTIVHHALNDYIPFLNKYNMNRYVELKKSRKIFVTHKPDGKSLGISVTNLIKHLPSCVIDECYNLLDVTKESLEPVTSEFLNIPIKSEQESGYETVNEITGLAIPSYFAYKISKKMDILEFMKKDKQFNEFYTKTINKEWVKYDINKINLKKLKLSELLFLSNLWNSYKNGYVFKLCQINRYNWLSMENLKKGIKRLLKLRIDKTSSFEFYLLVEGKPELLSRELTGFIDCVDHQNKRVYEFKCVKELSKEHFLQLAVYMYMFRSNDLGEFDFVLYNILSNESYKIECSKKKLTDLVSILFINKFIDNAKITDQEFIKKQKLNFESIISA